MYEKGIKKVVYTLAVGRYPKKITDLTFPLFKRYAKKIGAEFVVINKRRFPSWPAAYEKLQIYQLAQSMKTDWNIFFDADALIHPELPDLTEIIPRDHVAHESCDSSPVRWYQDRFFRRDHRFIGSCNWCAVGHTDCLELWKPLDDLTLEEAVKNIFPTMGEVAMGVTPEHLIDDYTLSRNIAKYGLKFKKIRDILRAMDLGNMSFFYHVYGVPTEEKVEKLRECATSWKVI